ncbi:hypothetical protein K7H13_02780 [Qipengyuania citrea]|nr:hypothetical protein [Qipengyuania citrea]
MLYHFREHIPEGIRPSISEINRQCPEYELMRGVTNATKHKALGRRKPLVTNAEDITETTSIVRFQDEIGDYVHCQTLVEVRCSDGSVRMLDPALTRALNYWGEFLARQGICNFEARPESSMPEDKHRTRDEASRQLNLEALRGLRFKHQCKFLEWDYEEGRARPVDLTGATLEARIYSPPKYTADLTMTHPAHGSISMEFPLTQEESLEIFRAASEKEKEVILDRIATLRRADIEAAFTDKLRSLPDAELPDT